MAINFDQLPTSNPNKALEDGIYRGKILEAVMRAPKDPSKAPYLNVTIQLFNKAGNKCGRLYDRFFDSEHSLMMYKLGQFIRAIKLNLQGASLELKDLTKLIVGKELYIDVVNKVNENSQNKMKFPEANVFGDEIYWAVDNCPLTPEEAAAKAIEDMAEDIPDSVPFEIEEEDSEEY